MIEQSHVEHHIRKHIISVLFHQKYARFRDMRPPRTDTNLYSYHLKLLQNNGFVTKTPLGYTLNQKGLLYVDRVSTAAMANRSQPKIISMLLIQNREGHVLLLRRARQPYIDKWSLIYGKLSIEDRTIHAAARREVHEKLGLDNIEMVHAGDCYIRIRNSQAVVMSTLAHVHYAEVDDIDVSGSDRLMWAAPHRLSDYELAPAVEQIVARTFFRDSYFFEEYVEQL